MIATRKIVHFFWFFLFLFALTAPLCAEPVGDFVYALDDNAFDKTNVFEDLKASDYFDADKYPFDTAGDCRFVNFVEYCYAYRVNQRANYGLYVYVYNPRELNIDTLNERNKIQLATAYDSNGTPTDYEKFSLKFCNASQGDLKNRFLKFKIIDRKATDGKYIVERVRSDERRYDVSGIELIRYKAMNAEEYSVGATYKFTGYVAGYGKDPNVEDTLKSDVNEMETVQLDVKDTYFRPETVSNLGKGHQNNLNSVYFAVPDQLLEKYGKLQRVKAEWWEYKTTPIAVIADTDAYNDFNPYVGVDIGDRNKDLKVGLLWGEQRLPGVMGQSYDKYDEAYNGDEKGTINITSKIPKLSWLFFTSNDIKTHIVSSNELKSYLNSYNKNLDMTVNGRRMSSDLLSSQVDKGHTAGYNIKDIDSEDKYDMLSYSSGGFSWWDKLIDFGLFSPDLKEEFKDFNAIVPVRTSDLSGDVSNKLLVNPNDVANLANFQTANAKNNKTTFLFRYSMTDYYSSDAVLQRGIPHGRTWGKAYVARETVFLDFDIIQLTFNRDGTYHVIPAVSSPIDVINSITPPLQDILPGLPDFSALKIVVAIALVLLFVLIVLWVVKKIRNYNSDNPGGKA